MHSVLPVLAVVGRPNVGKSTLFNRLTKTRDALVADMPGLTRDRHYGQARVGDRRFIVIDTGGFEPVAKGGIAAAMARQTRLAILEADAVVFVVDGRQGLTPHDQTIADELRKCRADVHLVVNKAEGLPRDTVAADFWALGLGTPMPISAAHGDGVRELIDAVLPEAPVEDEADDAFGDEDFDHEAEDGAEGAATGREAPAGPDAGTDADADADEPAGAWGDGGVEDFDDAAYADGAEAPEGEGAEPEPAAARREPLRIAIVGRPNVGKSTMINALVGEERVIAFDMPGTTRDAIAVPFERNGKPYVLIDTAGVRRRAKVNEAIEKFSVVKTLQAIEAAHVVVLTLDAQDGVSEQDAHIAGFILESGRALVIAVNKWDGLDEGARERIRHEFARKFHFLKFARTHFVSALKGFGLGAVMRSVEDAYAAATRKLPTPRLTRALREAVEKQAPPRKGHFRPKLRFAHQGGRNPPVIIVHGNSLEAVPDSYRRYLETFFRARFDLEGTPLRIEWKTGINPFVAKDGGIR